MKNKFRFLGPGFLFLLLALFTSCVTSQADKALFNGIEQAWNVVGPEYKTYVAEDPTLDQRTKETRFRTAELISKALETAKESK